MMQWTSKEILALSMVCSRFVAKPGWIGRPIFLEVHMLYLPVHLWKLALIGHLLAVTCVPSP